MIHLGAAPLGMSQRFAQFAPVVKSKRTQSAALRAVLTLLDFVVESGSITPLGGTAGLGLGFATTRVANRDLIERGGATFAGGRPHASTQSKTCVTSAVHNARQKSIDLLRNNP